MPLCVSVYGCECLYVCEYICVCMYVRMYIFVFVCRDGKVDMNNIIIALAS